MTVRLPRLRRSRLRKLVLLAGALLLSAPAQAQKVSILQDTTHFAKARSVVFLPKVVAKLAEGYIDNDPFVVERGYCLRYVETPGNDTKSPARVVVVDAHPAIVTYADQVGMKLWCPDLPGFTELHTHPKTSCRYDNGRAIRKSCVLDPGDWNCSASSIDVAALYAQDRAFALVQCSKTKFVVYGKRETNATRMMLGYAPNYTEEEQKQQLMKWLRWKYDNEPFDPFALETGEEASAPSSQEGGGRQLPEKL